MRPGAWRQETASRNATPGGFDPAAVVAPAVERAIGRLTQRAQVAAAPSLGLLRFIREGWHVPEPANRYVDGWHVGAIAEHLEAVSAGQIRDLIINIPPRFAKSLLVAVFWPAWEWTFAPWRRWLFATYAQNLTLRDSTRCRRLIESPWYQERWGGVYALTGDQNTKVKFENDRAGFRLATSVEGQGTGEGGDRVVVDDPHSAAQAQSDAEREGAVTWWRETMSTRGNDPSTRARVIVMQRLHERDLTGQMLDAGDYVHLMLPMRYEPKRRCVTSLGWEDPRTAPGELLWPQRFPEREVARLEKDLRAYGTAGQLQQRPAPVGGTIVKDAWWRYADRWPALFQQYLVSWDMTFKGDETVKKGRAADYVVGQVWGRTGADFYLLDQIRARLEFMESRRGVVALSRKHPRAHRKLIEDKANGPAIISSLRRHVGGIVAYEPPGDVVARVRAMATYVESGNVWLPGPALAQQRYEEWLAEARKPDAWLPEHYVRPAWVEEFVAEWSVVPKGANDDQVIAGCQALEDLSAAVDMADVEQRVRDDLKNISEAAAIAAERY